MMCDSQPFPDDPPASGKLRMAVVTLGLAALALLCANAFTMAICEDEANGFYLSKKPVGEIVDLMLANTHEDPPLSDLILHFWIRVAGYHAGLLRCLPMMFWLAMIPALFLLARQLAGQRGAWFALAALFLMPYHWTIPAVFRWYSLYACLAVWNFYSFLRLQRCVRGKSNGWKARLSWAVPYVATGACLWYTNYSAPVFFFTHLLVAASRAPRRRQVLIDLVLCWSVILLLYTPWIPTLLRQMDTSIRDVPVAYTGFSLYNLFAGELSTPFDFWISVPAAMGCVLLIVLVLTQFRRCWIPAVACAVALGALLQTGAIGPKRMLIVSPLVAVTWGAAMSNGTDRRRWLRMARAGLIATAVMVASGSLANMVRREGWGAYRWLDPTRAVAWRLQSRSPKSPIISNSNPVFFYLKDEYGKNHCRGPQEEDGQYQPKAILFPLRANYQPLCRDVLERAKEAVWVYHSPYHGPISKWYDTMVRQMQQFGFRVLGTEPLLRPSSRFIEFHPKFRDRSADPLDEYRVVLVYFVKSEPNLERDRRISRRPR